MLKTSNIKSNTQLIQEQSQIIYNHLQDCIQEDSPEIVIERFRHLFIKGTGYKNPQVRIALSAIVEASILEQDFYCFLSHCCHIIISYWYKHPNLKNSISLLIAQFDLALPPGSAHTKSGKKLRQLIRKFQNTEQYNKLKRLGTLITKTQTKHNFHNVNSLGDLIQRYPFLHQHCLLNPDSSYEFQKTIKTIQKEIQHRYELELSQYVTYRARLSEVARQSQRYNSNKLNKSLIQPVKNPTLLSDRKLNITLRQYLGKVEKNNTYKDLAHNFLNHNAGIRYYKVFQNNLYEYLTLGLDSEYCNSKLNPKIHQWLQEIVPDLGSRKLDEFTMIRTCSYLLKSLIVDSQKNPEHYLLIDMIVNLGTTEVIGLLLKLVLICPKIKPYLEQKFAILFSHYESFAKDDLMWLINSLEKLQLAFSIHFGKVDLSLVKIM
ncbi:MAG: hypothetical protein QNJ32_18430 [Xenococcaceae cyanobacterium MO_167.B27]|nr:hypothetical protein [Xenococcaceae cyanobacterium MO_167.B27]